LKDTYYFPHDYNAKDDPKCVLLIEQLGLEGYGIFWVLVETLRGQPDYKYPLALISALARRYNTSAEKMKAVVTQYQLFSLTEDGNFFFSESLQRRMEGFDRKREIARFAGKQSAEKRRLLNAGSTDVQQSSNDRSTSKVNKSKVKESKEYKDIFRDYAKDDEPLLNALLEFGEMRKSIKHPLSARAAQMLLTNLEKLASDSETKIRILEQSIFHDWQGVYSLKDCGPEKQSKPEHKPSFDIDEYERTSIYDNMKR
jgi:hypothetical protein